MTKHEKKVLEALNTIKPESSAKATCAAIHAADAASNNARKNFFISSPPDEADNADNENKDNSSAKSSYRRAGKERQ